MSTEGTDAREEKREKGADGDELEEANSGQNHHSPATSFNEAIPASGLFLPNIPQHLLQFHSMRLGPNYGGTATFPYDGSIDRSDYHLPVSNLAPQHCLESSTLIQLPYPNWHLHDPTAASGLPAPQEIQFQGVLGRAGGEPSNQLPYPNIQHQGFPSMHLNPNEMGESSSRNVRMRMHNLQEHNVPSAHVQLAGSWINLEIPLGPLRNSCYNPIYEEMGLPVDPHLRMFLVRREQGNSNGPSQPLQ